MIKYAHRGLVEDGKISTLFEKLYILIAVSCTVIFYSFSFPRKVEEKFKFRQCIREEMESVGFNSIKTAIMVLAFVLSMTILYSMLYFSCIFLIRKKIISVNGKYQRNVLTLKDTYMLSLLHLISIFIGLMVQSFSRFSPQSLELSSTFVDIFRIVVNGYILPVYILVNMYYKMPEFYFNKPKNVRKFVLKQEKIIPRPQLSPFSHLPYIALIRVNNMQEQRENQSNRNHSI